METFTVTIGEETVRCTETQWPIIANEAKRDGKKVYLVRDSDRRVISEG